MKFNLWPLIHNLHAFGYKQVSQLSTSQSGIQKLLLKKYPLEQIEQLLGYEHNSQFSTLQLGKHLLFLLK